MESITGTIEKIVYRNEENGYVIAKISVDKNEEKLVYSVAKCCNPIPGDKVFGFITIKE